VDPQRARNLLRASWIVSTVGIIVTLSVLVLMFELEAIGVICTGHTDDDKCY